MTSERDGRDVATWVVGAAAAVVLLGPLLWARGLMALDVVVLRDLRVPSGVWGLGPAIPRRGLWVAPAAAVATVLTGPVVVGALVAVAIASAFVGTARLARPTPTLCRFGAATLYALSPFVATRIGVGHLGLVLAMGVLPWALGPLGRAGEAPGAAFRWGALLALTGPFGGVLAGIVVAAGIIVIRGHRVRAAAVGLGSQALWIVPGAIVALQPRTGAVAGAGTFPTDVRGVDGWLGLAGGRGFWAAGAQVGIGGWVAAALGALVLGLACAGRRRVRDALGPVPETAALLAFAIAAASALPLVDRRWDALTEHLPFALVREGQRALPVTLLWLAVAAASGAVRLGSMRARWRDVAVALPLAAGLVLAGPGLWGAGGGMRTVRLPASWQQAQSTVAAAPGSVLALPWHQHLDLAIAGGHRVLNPLPELFGGDVISATDDDPAGATDALDARQVAVQRALSSASATQPLSGLLAPIGVRWVAVLTDTPDIALPPLAADPGLERVVTGGGLDLYSVRSWVGAAVDDAGRAVGIDQRIAPVASASSTAALTWFRAGGWGWLRGTTPATTTADGVLAVPSKSGPLWYWPSLLVLLAYAATAAIAAITLIRTSSAHRRTRPDAGLEPASMFGTKSRSL